jgi:WhiB family redox-sensing transcriptional regulator
MTNNHSDEPTQDLDPYQLPILYKPAGEWVKQAACIDAPTWYFFSDAETKDAYREGRKLCDICPVLLDCRQYAIENYIAHGLFGGMSPRERQLERRKIRMATGKSLPRGANRHLLP